MLLPDAPVGRIDRDAAAIGREPVVVGTQAVFGTGLRFELVVVADADSLELAPRYGAAEEAVWLMATAALMSGPRSGGGRVIVQTHRPRSAVVQALVRGDSSIVEEAEAHARADALLPPFGDLVRVTGPDDTLTKVADDLRGAPVSLSDGELLVHGGDVDPWRALLRRSLDTNRKKGARLRVEVE